MKNNIKGISLIALIITIIVIIILASTTILSFKEGKIVGKAEELALKNDIEAMKEELHSKVSIEMVDKDETDFNGPAEDFLETAKKYPGKFKVVNGKLYLVQDVVTDEEKKAAEDLNVAFTPSVPKGFVASQATGETDISTGLVIYEGTDVVNDSNVAAARENRNQFVWVPVDDINGFIRQSFYETSSNNYPPGEEPYSGASSSEITEYNAMYESVKKYHGFYIARYEASKDDTTNKAQSKKNKTPLSTIWGNSMTDLSGGAVEAARAVYPASQTTTGVVSTLIYGVEWDQAVRFIEKNYPGISKDSTGRGNYGTGSIANTGSSDAYAQNNIYDMCGNRWEWTMEPSSSAGRFYRGGTYGGNGKLFPISTRVIYGPVNQITNGYRIALYIK